MQLHYAHFTICWKSLEYDLKPNYNQLVTRYTSIRYARIIFHYDIYCNHSDIIAYYAVKAKYVSCCGN
jgi:hypothetical protein